MSTATFIADILQNVNVFIGQDPQSVLDNEPIRLKILNELRILQNTLQRPEEAVRNVAMSVRLGDENTD